VNAKPVIEVISWLIVAAIIVLIVMNASNFAKVISSIGGFWETETAMFTGAGYGRASGTQYSAAGG
jgi:hypothetical protein